MSTLENLARRLDELELSQAALVEERDHHRTLYQEMLERCRKLERGLLSMGAERAPQDAKQLSLDILALALESREEGERDDLAKTQEVKPHRRKKPTGRKPLPEGLPREVIEVLPDEVKREGLDAFEKIGEDVTETVERRRGGFVVARIKKPKFKRKGAAPNTGSEILVAPTPALPIPRCLAGPGLLADTLVKRWQDHLPLHRLEGIYARDGLPLARSTMCGWHEALAELLSPLIDAMRADALEQPLICTDATGVLVQAKEKCRRGHFWVLVAPKRHVLFEYTRDHSGDSVDSILAGYEGYLVADAHTVYDHLYADGRVTEVNCWAHARRYFFRALSTDPERAKAALGMIGALFRVERAAKNATRKKRERLRKKHSAPIAERFFSWCTAEKAQVLEDTPIYDGVRYALNQKQGLLRFLDDGRLPLDNNISERELRRQAVGRKNWLFVGSDDGARANACATSLLASCRMLDIEPWAYLRDLLCLLPDWPIHNVLELAPVNWVDTLKREDVQAKLEADPYRKLTLPTL